MNRILEDNENINTIESTANPANAGFAFSFIKRLFDIVFSIFLSPIALMLIIIFGFLIKIEDNGTIFYSQMRVGKNLKEFKIYKLRSMVMNAEELSGSVWAEKDDPRITKVGKIIRKFRIDELPQLVNTLKGEMSVIGPRPERLDLTLKFENDHPGFIQRTQVKPGLTGLAQINGGYDISPSEKLKFDIEYMSNLSLVNEIKILVKTVLIVITGDGSR